MTARFQRKSMVAWAGLTGAVLVCAVGLWAWQPAPWTAVDTLKIGAEAAARLESVLWVDARSEQAVAAHPASDAVRLTPAAWEAGIGRLMERWEPGRAIVVYCDGADCGTSREVAQRLRDELGINNVWALDGGWAASPNL
jgi:rhodanese-related sulfurtransferase